MKPIETRSQVSNLGQLLTVQELATYLGIPTATLYTWRHRGDGPPGFRVGRHLRYRQDDVEDWIRQQIRGTQR